MNQKEVVLGVDIGGTNTAFGYVDRDGNLLAEAVMPTEAHRPAEEFFARLHTEAENLFASKINQLKLVGIGLGAPNGNYYKGTIEQPPNLSWKYVDVVATLKKWYTIPVVRCGKRNERFYCDYTGNRPRQRHCSKWRTYIRP
jgi:glucokinase